MNVVFCWSDISGYMASCWRALAQRPGVNVFVFAWQVGAGERNIAFSNETMRGIPHRLLNDAERNDKAALAEMVAQQRPDVVVVSGWFHPPYRALPDAAALRATKFVMGVDTPYRGTLRQHLGRFRMGRYLDRMDAVVVAGERAFQLARVLRIPERKIVRGVYGFDEALFAPAAERRGERPWPKKFLFVGRYVEDKAIDVLVEAHRAYASRVSDPWPLTCGGRGPLAELVRSGGHEDRGFVQPNDLPALLLEHGVFVIPSRYEPWGVVIAEALSSGMPVICSEACGASVELVRAQFNGLTVATSDAASLARALQWTHEHYDLLPEMGRRGTAVASAFSDAMWVRRWSNLFQELCAAQ